MVAALGPFALGAMVGLLWHVSKFWWRCTKKTVIDIYKGACWVRRRI